MNNQIIVPEIPPTEETLNLDSNGNTFICKRVWLDAYRKLTIWFYETGMPYKQEYKEID